MALVHSTSLYTLLYHGSTYGTSWFYLTQHYSIMAPFYTTWLYITLPLLYFPLYYSTMALLHSTSLYITLPWLYYTLLHSTVLFHGSTYGSLWFYFTQHHSIMAPFYTTLHYSAMALLLSILLNHGSILHSTSLYIIQPLLYFTLFTLHDSTMTTLHYMSL